MEEWRFDENVSRICRNDKEGLREIHEDYSPLIYSVVEEILVNRRMQRMSHRSFLFACGILPLHTGQGKDTGHG